MNFRDVLCKRRSVRKFTDREISTQTLDELTRLAQYSPSWKNSQSIRLNYIKDRELITKIAEASMEHVPHNQKILASCNVLVALTGVPGLSGMGNEGEPFNELGDAWQMFDAGLITQSLLLAAHEQGIGSVVIGAFSVEKARRVLPIDEDERLLAFIALGYYDHEVTMRKRKAVEEVSRHMPSVR